MDYKIVKKFLILTLLFILSFSLISAQDIYDDCTIYGNCIDPIIFDNNTAFVNESKHWVTDSLGVLSDGNSTQFNGDGGVLSIIESWVDSLWCRLTGCTMEGDIDMDGNNIFNVGNLTVLNKLFLSEEDHWIRKGAIGFNGLSENAIAIQHAEEHSEGTITFIVTANITNSDIDGVSIMAQSGLNNSGGFLGNSWMIAPNNLSINLTKLSNCFFVINATGNIPRISCDTGDTGSDLFVQDDIQTGGTIFAEVGIRAETIADFIMNGNDMQIENGSLHILTQVDFQSGVTEGQEIFTFNEFFTGGIGAFTNLQTDIGNWFATSDILCDDGDCGASIGISGAGNIIMEANISTTNINSTTLSFVYSLVNMLGSNSFTVTVNNNVGSGEVILLTDSTNNVILNSQSIAMPSSMWDQPKVSIRFECDVTQANRECFVDTIRVNGTAIATTLTNQSGFNSQICFSDGTRNAGGVCNVGIFYNASLNTVFPKGSWNLSGASASVDHSALTNLEWASTGHTFSALNQNFNIGSYNFIVNNSVFFVNSTAGNVGVGTANPQNKLNVVGDLNVTQNATMELVKLGNGAWMGYNATCQIIFYNSTGGVLSTLGCT